MAKQSIVTPWGESWVDVPEAPVQKFTPIDVQTKAQDAIKPQYTKNLLNTQEQAAQKVQPTVTPVAQQPQQQPVVSPVSQQTMPVARQDQTNKDWVANASVQGGQWSTVTPLSTVATRANPVVSKPIPEKAPEKANLAWVTPPTWNADELQRFVDEWAVRTSNGELMTPQDKLQLIQAQRQLQKLQAPSATTNPFDAQITRQNDLKTQRQQALQAQTDSLIQTEQQRQAKAADIAVADAQQAGERQKQAAQAVLSFSGFWRSTFSAQQQADIQWSVERNIASIQAQKDAAVEQYRAKLNNATAEEMKMYDDNIAKLELESSNYLIELAWKIDTYNRQVNADYATKVDDILKLAQQNAPITPLTDAEKQKASAYAWMLVKDNWDINQEILKLVPPKLLSEALSQWAKLKWSMWSEKTVKDANDNVFQYNPQTGRYDIPVWEKAQAKSERASMTWGGLYNKATWEVKQVWNISNAPTQQATNFLSMSVWEKSDFECGWYASRATGNNWTPWGNDKQARIRAFSSKEPKEWGMVLFAWDGYDKTYWHIAVVTAVNQDWTMTVKESNLNWDKKITERTIPISSATWFFNNTPLAKWQTWPSWTKQLPAWSTEQIWATKTAMEQTQNLFDLLENNKDKFWPIVGKIWANNPYDAKSQALNAEFAKVAQIVWKSLEGWKLAEWDIKRYVKMLPQITDTPEVAKEKLNSVMKYLEDYQNWQIESLWRAWFNVWSLYSEPKTTPKTTNKPTTAPQKPATQAPKKNLDSVLWI